MRSMRTTFWVVGLLALVSCGGNVAKESGDSGSGVHGDGAIAPADTGSPGSGSGTSTGSGLGSGTGPGSSGSGSGATCGRPQNTVPPVCARCRGELLCTVQP